MMLAGLEQPGGGMALPLGGNFRGAMRAGAILLLGASAAAAATGAAGYPSPPLALFCVSPQGCHCMTVFLRAIARGGHSQFWE